MNCCVFTVNCSRFWEEKVDSSVVLPQFTPLTLTLNSPLTPDSSYDREYLVGQIHFFGLVSHLELLAIGRLRKLS